MNLPNEKFKKKIIDRIILETIYKHAKVNL